MEDNQEREKAEKELYEKKRQAMYAAVKRMRGQSVQQVVGDRFSLTNHFSSEEIDRFMKNPRNFQRQLRQISNYLYDYSAEYRQIIDYMAELPSWKYVLDPDIIADEKTEWNMVQKNKLKASRELEKMNLPHELSKISAIAWKNDVFYGYEFETKDTYTIKSMSPDFCRISSTDGDGVFLYEFDFSYFDGNQEELNSYGEEFKRKYKQYQNTHNRWIELDSRRAFAIKINETVQSYPLIPYSILFDPIFDLEEYKKIQKARAKMDNFMLLVQRIPINDKNQSMDDFLISLELAEQFHNQASDALGDGIGLVTSPMEINSVRTEKSGKDKDNVATALREVYNAGGVSQFLFNSDKSTSTGVNKSVIVDEQKSYRLMRQIERWLNRKLRRASGRYKMKLKFLDITSFDDGESFDAYLTAAQNGFPTIEEAASSVGVTPLQLHNRLMMSQSSMNYQKLMSPLQTSHTQSGDSENSGAPEKSDDEISDSGQINRDANTDEEKKNK